jgi:hypothetical protein
MQCVIEPYKLAWIDAGQLHSSMHPTLAEAEARASIIMAPKMIMKLSAQDGGSYSWQMMPGPFTWIVKNYMLLTLAAILLLLFVEWKYTR